jgi:hypothetical protein
LKTTLETEAVVQLTIAVRRANVVESLKNPGAPVTVISAGGDTMIPREAHEKLFRSIAPRWRAQYVLMRAASHYIPERMPEAQIAARFIHSAIAGRSALPFGLEGEVSLSTGEFRFLSPEGRRISFTP